MDGNDFKYFEGKRVYVVLKNHRVYSGKVINVDTNSFRHYAYLVLEDKFGHRVIFTSDEIEILQEEKKDAA